MKQTNVVAFAFVEAKIKRFVNTDAFKQEHLFELFTDERKKIIVKQINQFLIVLNILDFVVYGVILDVNNNLEIVMEERI